MAAALQIVPAGARQISPGVFQARPMRRGGRAMTHKKKSYARGKTGFFSRQWVWFAFALMLGEVAQLTLFKTAPKWMSVPALILYAYGTAKKKPGAINAAYALQGARLLAYFGVTGTVAGLASKAMSGGGFGVMNMSDGGGGSRGGFMPGALDVSFDQNTFRNLAENAGDAYKAYQVVAAAFA